VKEKNLTDIGVARGGVNWTQGNRRPNGQGKRAQSAKEQRRGNSERERWPDEGRKKSS